MHRPATALVGALAAGRDFCITVAMDVEATDRSGSSNSRVRFIRVRAYEDVVAVSGPSMAESPWVRVHETLGA